MSDTVTLPFWFLLLILAFVTLGYVLIVWRQHQRDIRHYKRTDALIGAVERTFGVRVEADQEAEPFPGTEFRPSTRRTDHSRIR